MSRNECDQRNLKAASNISARVRSDRPIVCVGSGLKTTPETDNFADMTSDHTDMMLINQGAQQLTTVGRFWRLEADWHQVRLRVGNSY
jgi:hypothetical protein